MLKKWKLLRSEIVFESPFISLLQEDLEKEDGKVVKNFYSVKRRDAVFVLALTEKQEVVLVYQYKNGIKDLVWEIPAGYIESGETPAQAATRELLEETGYSSSEIKKIGEYVPNPAISPNRNHVFLITNAKLTVPPKFDENEEIEVKLLPFEDLVEDIKKRRSLFTDLQSQLTLLLVWEELQK